MGTPRAGDRGTAARRRALPAVAAGRGRRRCLSARPAPRRAAALRDPGTRPPGRAARCRSPRCVRPTGWGRAAGLGERAAEPVRGGLLGRGPARRQTRGRPHSEGRLVPHLGAGAAHLLDTGLLGTGEQAPGLLDKVRTEQLARLLGGPAMDSGWGLRSLGAKEAAYNPFGHRSGAVRVQETAIAVAGLAAAGYEKEASALLRGCWRRRRASAIGCPRCTPGSSGRPEVPRCRIRPPADRPRRRRPRGCCCSPPFSESVPTPLRGP